jgi:hypothetical protein
MKIINVVRDKVKLKLIETSFCLGVGLDQLTPCYHTVIFTHFVGYVIKDSKPVDSASIHTKPVNTDKLYKSNYGRRVSFKK